MKGPQKRNQKEFSVLLDIERIVSLADLTGTGVYQIIDHFADGLMERIAALGCFSGEESFWELRMTVHEIKGSALTCGFLAVGFMLDRGGVGGGAIDLAGLEARASESIEAWKQFLSDIRS